jgi:aspartate ammonia-lyase
MNIEEIKKEVVYSESQTRLFEITIELTEEISKCYIELLKVKEDVKKVEIKGNISLFTTLQNIIEKRLDDVTKQELYSYRRFRIVAETVLKKETMERILELSTLIHQDFKGKRAELKANKLE